MKVRTLSTVPTTLVTAQRTTQATRNTLLFIHRFRHVTASHVQLALGHRHFTTTQNHLTRLCAKGYIARQYGSQSQTGRQPASYYLSPEGLQLLKTLYPERTFRKLVSLRSDAAMGLQLQERYHTLADTYMHFKRHYDGRFEFFTAHDLTSLDQIANETPDGYVRVTLPKITPQHYLIEIYGWGRSTQVQRRRLANYFGYAESVHWHNTPKYPLPVLFIVAASSASQRRLNTHVTELMHHSCAEDFRVYTTTRAKLSAEQSTIWHGV